MPLRNIYQIWPLFKLTAKFVWKWPIVLCIIIIGVFRGESSKEKSERSTQSSRRANDTKNSTRAWMCKAYINNRTTIRALRTSVLVRTYQYMYDHFSAILIRYYTKCYFGLWNDFPLAKNYFLVQNYYRPYCTITVFWPSAVLTLHWPFQLNKVKKMTELVRLFQLFWNIVSNSVPLLL